MPHSFSFVPSTDYALIRSIATHPRLFPWLRDDFSPEPADYRPHESSALLYLLAYDGHELLGFWMFVPHNAICWEVHTALLPHAWGRRALRAVEAMFEWVWENTRCRKLITNVPVDNLPALEYARRAGMQEIGINTKSFMRGKLLDQVVLGLNRPEV